MVLHIISDDEELTGSGHFYIKSRVMKEIKEIHFEIMNNRALIKNFYGNFEKNVAKIDYLFQHLNDITPGERLIMISTLPPIPSFLHGSRHMITLKVIEDQYNSIGAVANVLNTTLSNMLLVTYFISLPTNLYCEFPYLIEHYKFIEEYLNYYIEKTNGSMKLREYDTIKSYISE